MNNPFTCLSSISFLCPPSGEMEKAPTCERKRSHLMTDLKEELTPSENEEDDDDDGEEEEEGDVVFVYGLDDDSIPKIDRKVVEEMEEREEEDEEDYGYPKDGSVDGPV